MISGIITLVLLLSFIGGWVWAWRPARRAEFDAAARTPLREDDIANGDAP
jgi:cytochrome c oxidase cbb3-type subunit IV